MPKLPGIGQIPGPGVLNLPRPGPGAFGADAAQGLGALADIASKLSDQNDRLETSRLEGELSAGIKAAQIEAERSPDFLQHGKVFSDRVAQIEKEILKKASNGRVRSTLKNWQLTNMPSRTLEVEEKSLRLMNDAQIAELNNQEEALSLRAAESQTAEERDEVVRRYGDLIIGARDIGSLNPIQVQERTSAFKQKVLLKNMDYLRRTDRSLLREKERAGEFNEADPNKRLQILEQADLDERQEQSNLDRIVKESHDEVLWHWTGLANSGQLTESEIDLALKGQHALISPTEARSLKEINDSPPTTTGNDSVGVIMQEYYMRSRTLENISQARNKLNRLALDLGRPNKKIMDALNQLGGHESEARSVAAQEKSANIKSFEEAYKSAYGPTFTNMQKNLRDADILKGRIRIEQGEKPEDVLNDLLQQNQIQQEDLSPSDQKVRGLLGR